MSNRFRTRRHNSSKSIVLAGAGLGVDVDALFLAAPPEQRGCRQAVPPGQANTTRC